MRITRGFPEAQRRQAAALFWQAFSGKLGRVLAPEAKAVSFLEIALQPANAFAALDESDRLVGLAGIKTGSGGFVGGALRDIARVYGWPGAVWRAAVLDLTARPLAPRQMLLDGICVDASVRGQGIGSALIEAIVAEGRRLELSEIRLDVIDSNPRARALYERHGFEARAEERLGPLSYIFGFRSTTTMIRSLKADVR